VNKAIKYFALGFVALALLAGAFAGGYLVGYRQTPAALTETWNIIHNQYVDPVDDAKLVEGAINGMLETLPFGANYYLTAEEAHTWNEIMNGREYEGIGAYVDTSQDYLTIIVPIAGSPADKAGLRKGDQIIKIDGEDMTGVEPEAARQRVLGPANSQVVLTIKRGSLPPFDVTITRAKIITPLVESKMVSDNDIAYIRITSYGDSTDTELRAALTTLLANKPKGLILDLRNNGGGYLHQAVAVLSEFLPADTLVVTEETTDAPKEEKTSGEGVAQDIPMVVLINGSSASASEITAGALQDYGRAQLVGEKSYGKGSVQIQIPLENSEGLIGITIAKWLTPNGRQIDKLGLEPDLKVELTAEDAAADRDPQLEKAIELLK
jgi:carboxyl-terminal processing protease